MTGKSLISTFGSLGDTLLQYTIHTCKAEVMDESNTVQCIGDDQLSFTTQQCTVLHCTALQYSALHCSQISFIHNFREVILASLLPSRKEWNFSQSLIWFSSQVAETHQQTSSSDKTDIELLGQMSNQVSNMCQLPQLTKQLQQPKTTIMTTTIKQKPQQQ